jgi:shikimate dehydrogenase
VSPAMHNAAFETLGLDWQYVPLPVDPTDDETIGQAVDGLRALGFRGANVTIPHKQAVMPHLDDISDAATAIGAVNTICVTDKGRLKGDNTDASGFLADLKAHKIDPASAKCLVLGAGGAAHAVVYALARAGAGRIAIAGWTDTEAPALLEKMSPRFWTMDITALRFQDGFETELAKADLIVNCTPIGMSGNAADSACFTDSEFDPDQVIYDLVYNPRQTPLMGAAINCGATAHGGLGMLVQQGALAFEIWTGRKAPVEIMRRIAEKQL